MPSTTPPTPEREPAQPEARPGAPGLTTRKNFSWALLGNILYSATQWAILVAIARLGTARAVGQFSYALAITAPIVLLLSGRTVQVTDSKRRFSTGDHLGQRLSGVFVTTGVVVVLAATLGADRATTLAILLLGIAKGIESIADVFHGTLHQAGRLDLVSRSLVLRGTLSACLFASTFWLSQRRLEVACLALTITWLTILVFYDIPTARRISDPGWLRRTSGGIRAVWKLTAPVGIASALYSFVPNFPRYTLESYLGPEAVGFYSALAYLLVASRTVSSAASSAVSPRLADAWQTSDKQRFTSIFYRTLLGMAAFSIAALAIAITAGKFALELVYGPPYGQHTETLIILTAAAGVQQLSTVYNAGLAAKHRFRWLSATNAVGLATIAACAPSFVDSMGIPGAGWSLLLATSASAAAKMIGFYR